MKKIAICSFSYSVIRFYLEKPVPAPVFSCSPKFRR